MSLDDRLKSLENCLEKFREILKEPKNDIVRDSAIKRFELCYELLWKTLKDFLAKEGIICNSPKNCFRMAFSNGLIEDEGEWLNIIDDRNLSVHTYNESLAEDIYSRLGKHYEAMYKLFLKMKEELDKTSDSL